MTRAHRGGLPDVRVWRANPFVLPTGPAGRAAGRLMARANRAQQREVLRALDVRPGQRVLEIGYGPGVLVRLLAERTGAALVAGVDPSPAMHRQATAAGRFTPPDRRVVLRQAGAERLPFEDGSFDRVVAVNNCQGWADPQAGLREVHRVLRPGGNLLIAVHSRAAPGRLRSLLGLPEELLDDIRRDIERVFAVVERRDLRYSVTFTATPCR